MSIANKLTLLQQDITNARTAITTKGGTVTTGGGSSQLATDIATIPSGGGSYICITTNKKLATLTCGSQTYTLVGNELSHAFKVSAGTYICTSTLGELSTTKTVTVTTSDIYSVEIRLSNVPAEYQEVEYIQSTGTQYISTNILMQYDFKIEAKINVIGTVAGALFGTSNYNLRCMASSGVYIQWGGSTASLAVLFSETKRKSWITIIENLNGVLIDGVRIVDFNSTTTTTDTLGFRIFGANTSASYSGIISSCISNLIIKQGDTVIAKFYPCYEKASNVAGMYETVSNTFYTNAGTGIFVVGGDI